MCPLVSVIATGFSCVVVPGGRKASLCNHIQGSNVREKTSNLFVRRPVSISLFASRHIPNNTRGCSGADGSEPWFIRLRQVLSLKKSARCPYFWSTHQWHERAGDILWELRGADKTHDVLWLSLPAHDLSSIKHLRISLLYCPQPEDVAVIRHLCLCTVWTPHLVLQRPSEAKWRMFPGKWGYILWSSSLDSDHASIRDVCLCQFIGASIFARHATTPNRSGFTAFRLPVFSRNTWNCTARFVVVLALTAHLRGNQELVIRGVDCIIESAHQFLQSHPPGLFLLEIRTSS